MAPNLCLEPGCDQIGVFPGVRHHPDGDVTGAFCFAHDPAVSELSESGNSPTQETPDPLDGYHPDVTAGLAAMILEHVAMTTMDGDDPTGDAMRSLAANTALSLDIAAGVLLACTSIAAAGEVPADRLTELAEVWEATITDDNDDQAATVEVGPDDDRDAMADECAYCNGTGVADDLLTGEVDVKCPWCDGRGILDIVGPASSPIADDFGDDDLPESVVPGEPLTESETAA